MGRVFLFMVGARLPRHALSQCLKNGGLKTSATPRPKKLDNNFRIFILVSVLG